MEKVKRAASFSLLFGVVAASLGPVSTAHASIIDLYDFALNTNTGISGDWQDPTTNDPTLIIDPTSSIYNDTNCCGNASGGTSGLGTINLTFNPGAPGSYTVSLYLDYDVSTPFYNEYGTINNPGMAQSGLSYEIFNPSITGGNIVLYPATGVSGSEVYGAADDTNHVPGTNTNFSDNCTNMSICNADVGFALTFNFMLGSGQEALITVTADTSAPSGFSLQDTHPIDGSNNSASSVYLSGSYSIQSITTSAPEPTTWILFAPALAFGAIKLLRRRSASR